MRYKVQAKDFIVEERIQLPLTAAGDFAIYRVRKREVSTLSVRAQMAGMLKKPQSHIVFPALKDKAAVAVQYAAVRGAGPEEIAGRGFEAHSVGRASRPLTPSDLAGNHFTIVLRDLSRAEAAHLKSRATEIGQFGLPNYFDQQRFGSWPCAEGETHIAKRILQRDEEGALRAYLAQPFVGDPHHVHRFKAQAQALWPNWQAIFEAAPSPSNFRSVLTYLRDHPDGGQYHFRKALNLINRRLLSIYLSAYQSLLWNRIAGRYSEELMGEAPAYVEIARERLPVYHRLPDHVAFDMTIALPSHRARYKGSLQAIATRVLQEEGFVLNDIKARVLKKAYLTKGRRALFLFPDAMTLSDPQPDERFSGRQKVSAAFALSRGSYATLVLKALAV